LRAGFIDQRSWDVQGVAFPSFRRFPPLPMAAGQAQ
jgi:hypothetical protein